MNIHIFNTRDEMGQAAAEQVALALEASIETKGKARIILAAAPSQAELYKHLVMAKNVDWTRVEAFHMDEYHTLPPGHPELFSGFLRRHIVGLLPFKRFEAIRPGTGNTSGEATRYARLLREEPIDVCCMGIGENGHLAFNDPPVANFKDVDWVKEVTLDEPCRLQQVHDAGFETLSDVPEKALTLTIPALMSARFCSVVVPGPRKAKAVRDALEGPISEVCPASIIRQHPNLQVFLDNDSASLLNTAAVTD